MNKSLQVWDEQSSMLISRTYNRVKFSRVLVATDRGYSLHVWPDVPWVGAYVQQRRALVIIIPWIKGM